MQALQDATAALGQPVLLRLFGPPSGPRAAIARWRHSEPVVEVGPSNAIRLAMSLLDVPNTRDRAGSVSPPRGGALSVFSPSEGATVALSGEADVLQLFLDEGHVEAMLESPLPCPPMFGLRDDAIRSSVLRILVGSARTAPDDAVMVDEQLHAVAIHLARHAARRRNGADAPQRPLRGGLSPAAYRRVDALIAQSLDDQASLSLSDMAVAASLSVTHFVRAFRHHTGETPHRHLVRRRMERAVALLRHAGTPVAEVADQVGFATPAHFVAAFREIMGVTPGCLREGLTA